MGVKFVSYQSEMYHLKGIYINEKDFYEHLIDFQTSGKSKRNNIKVNILLMWRCPLEASNSSWGYFRTPYHHLLLPLFSLCTTVRTGDAEVQ